MYGVPEPPGCAIVPAVEVVSPQLMVAANPRDGVTSATESLKVAVDVVTGTDGVALNEVPLDVSWYS